MFQCLDRWIKGSRRLLPYWHLRCSVRFPVPVLPRHRGWRHNHSCPEEKAIPTISQRQFPVLRLFWGLSPPSITLIVYASITDLSVSKLFVGSVIPGSLMAVGLIIYALFYGKKNDLPAHERKSAKEVLLIFKDSIWALLMPVIILGGIFGGILHQRNPQRLQLCMRFWSAC